MFVDQRQDAQATPVMILAMHKVEAPDVIAMERSQPNAGAIVQPETAAWSIILRDLEALTTPDPLNSVLAQRLARCLQQRGDTAVAVASVLGRQGDDGAGQRILIGRHGGHVALRAPVLVNEGW